jgi:endonuclease/exonuclease/phosphatase family metal-dependent hydrolase
MNSKITNENTLRIEELFKRAINNNKSSSSNLSNIKFNQDELDILSKEILEENKPQLTKEDNNQININLSKEEINTLLNEINNNTNIKKEEKSFLSKKRRKNFISVKIQQDKQNFIHYKQKQQINEENDNFRNRISLLSYNILNQIFMKKMNRPDLNIDYRMNKIKQEILKLDPDIFCLQEADMYVYEKYLLKKDMEQYNILYGINCGSSFINIIAYKKDKFELKSFKNFSLLFLGKSAGNRGIMTVDLQLINNEVNNNNNNENNIKEKEQNKINNNKNITIYNVHFPWKYENDRILLMNLLFQHIKENHNLEDNNSIFILGDFNSEPPSRTVKLFYYNKIKNDKRNFYIKKYKSKKKSFDLHTFQLAEYIYNNFKFQSA